jgi:hypothetical protein
VSNRNWFAALGANGNPGDLAADHLAGRVKTKSNGRDNA